MNLLFLSTITFFGCQSTKQTQNSDSNSKETASEPENNTDTQDTEDTPDPSENHCEESDSFFPVYDGLINNWIAQDNQNQWPPEPLVAVGSSSIRRWEDFAWSYRDYTPLQRGFGGAQLGEVAQRTADLATRHNPKGIILFAGTNDVAFGVEPEIVVERFRCFRQRVAEDLDPERPIFFVGITPTPARWNTWEQAEAVNSAIQEIAAQDSGVYYVDIPSAFLETGQPPDASLFVSDQLHLSESGYELWNSVLRPIVENTITPAPSYSGSSLPSGTRVLIDLGPSNAEDGEHTPSPDWQGQHWNNWYSLEGDSSIFPGEHLDNLVDISDTPTDIDLVISAGFKVNGRSNGGLLWPSQESLGNLASGSATGDYFYSDNDDVTGGLFLRNLDPAQSYTLRIFASREEQERRVTTYTINNSVSQALQTSGSGAGTGTAVANDNTIIEFTGIQPDSWGQIHLDVQLTEGSYAYLSLLELIVE